MNCEWALDTLRSGNEQHTQWDSACEHLADCSSCQREFRSLDTVDELIGDVCRNIPVPQGLEQSILSDLELNAAPRDLRVAQFDGDAKPAALIAEASTIRKRRSSTRWFSRRRALIALLILVSGGLGFAGYLAWENSRRVSVEQLILALSERLDRDSLPVFTRFASRVALRAPEAMQVDWPEAGARRLRVGSQFAAVYFVRTPSQEDQVVGGRLLVIPTHAVINPPAWEGFSSDAVDYANRACAWREGELVYIFAWEGSLEDLYRLFPPQHAG